MSPLVEEALKYLTTTCNTSALYLFDEDNIKLTLKALHKHGEALNPNKIESWVLANHWKPIPAKSISTWANTIASNGQVRMKYRLYLSSEKEVLSQLQARLAAKKSQVALPA